MYGLNHRFTTDLANVTPIGARATVLVIDRDPLTLSLVEQAVAGHYEIVVAIDGRLEVRSPPGGGTVVRGEIPCHAIEGAANAPLS